MIYDGTEGECRWVRIGANPARHAVIGPDDFGDVAVTVHRGDPAVTGAVGATDAEHAAWFATWDEAEAHLKALVEAHAG